MLIGIDAHKAASKNKTGVENLVYQLILNFKKADKENIYFLYTNKPLPKELTDQFNMIECLVRVKRGWNRFGLNFAILRHRPDVYLQPSDSLPLMSPKKSVAIIHDLAWKTFPSAYLKKQIIANITTIKSYLKRARKIICISKSTMTDLIHYFPATKNQLEVIYISCDKEKFSQTTNPKDFLKLESPYILFTGRLEERKNILNIISSYETLRQSNHNITHKLVLTGLPGFNYEQIYQKINQSKFIKDIILTGYVSDKNYPDLLAGADVFVFCSFYEGFGIPILEAFSAKVPVITSKISSMPEVAGDAAILVDPNNIEEIAKSMYKVITDKDMHRMLVTKGQERLNNFSWEKTAQDYLHLFKKL